MQRRVADHPGQGFQADATLADARVSVFVGADGVFAVVEMDGFQAVQADHAVKLRQYAVQVADDVVAAVGDMAGVQADAHFVP